MSARIDLQELTTRITAAVDPAVEVGTSYQRDYIDKFSSVSPAVWVKAQRAIALDNNFGAVSRPVQRFAVEFLVTVVYPRYNAGTFDAEDPANSLVDQVVGALMFETLTGADVPLTLNGTTDGQQDGSVITVDLLFRTEVVYYA